MQSSLQSKVDQIRAGATRKTDLGVKQNKNVIQGKGAKFIVEEKEKKFEEAGVKRKKRNYVLYESKLGTEKEQNLKKIEEPKPKPKPKPKPVPVARPRMEEKIFTHKRRLEYLDNYQYLETKVIKRPNPNRVSIVTHQRLGDIIGGFYEEKTFQKQIIRNTGNLPSSSYSSQTTKTSSRGGPTTTKTQKIVTTSRTQPAQPKEYRKEVVQKNMKQNIPIRGNKSTITTTKTVTTTQRSSSRPRNARDNISGNSTTTTTMRKVVTRSQSAGRRH